MFIYSDVNSGHYTAYAKHPMTEKWYYFNDEQISERLPGEEEYSSAYVLFYQRKGECVNISDRNGYPDIRVPEP